MDLDGTVSFAHHENMYVWGGSGADPSKMVVWDTTTKKSDVITTKGTVPPKLKKKQAKIDVDPRKI